MMDLKYNLSFWLILLLIGCNTPESKEKSTKELAQTDTIKEKPLVKEEEDPFTAKVNLVADSLASWGYQLDTIVQSVDDYKNHWWLINLYQQEKLSKTIDKPLSDDFPTAEDFASIKNIRHAIFKKGWRIYIEEWQMDSPENAKKWAQIIKARRKSKFTKPPKHFWVEEDKIFFVMTTAAKDWFEYSDKIIKIANPK